MCYIGIDRKPGVVRCRFYNVLISSLYNIIYSVIGLFVVFIARYGPGVSPVLSLWSWHNKAPFHFL
nr:MAG TPA: hypothetical protein [Caudoviricetes sp.]